jgi:hypothetical protein
MEIQFSVKKETNTICAHYASVITDTVKSQLISCDEKAAKFCFTCFKIHMVIIIITVIYFNSLFI